MKQRFAPPAIPLQTLKTFSTPEEKNEPTVVPVEKVDIVEKSTSSIDGEDMEILVSEIDPSPYQPRIEFDDDELLSLADSIDEVGLINPIRVRQQINGRYELIAGERRTRAYQLLGRTTILAKVAKLTDEEAAIEALTENEARKNLCDYERGKSFDRILRSGAVASQGQLARKVGISKTAINRCLSFLKLPPSALAILDKYPSAIGGSTVSEFLEPELLGSADIIDQAITMIVQDGVTEIAAVKWAKAEVAKNKGKALLVPRQIIIGGVHYGDLKVEGRKMIISCQKNIDPEILWSKIQEALANQA